MSTHRSIELDHCSVSIERVCIAGWLDEAGDGEPVLAERMVDNHGGRDHDWRGSVATGRKAVVSLKGARVSSASKALRCNWPEAWQKDERSSAWRPLNDEGGGHVSSLMRLTDEQKSRRVNQLSPSQYRLKSQRLACSTSASFSFLNKASLWYEQIVKYRWITDHLNHAHIILYLRTLFWAEPWFLFFMIKA